MAENVNVTLSDNENAQMLNFFTGSALIQVVKLIDNKVKGPGFKSN